MMPDSPVDALGRHAAQVRDLLVEVVRNRHDRSVEAHKVADTSYGFVFGGQWKDLLRDAHDVLTGHGFSSHTLRPAGYTVPLVNDCLVYVWRIPDGVDPVGRFASSPTRKNGFAAEPPAQLPLEFDVHPAGEQEGGGSDARLPVRAVLGMIGSMPVVLVMISSSPRQLQSITWAIAVMDESGSVSLRGPEVIWEPEPSVVADAAAMESFDSGEPAAPIVELHARDGSQPDER